MELHRCFVRHDVLTKFCYYEGNRLNAEAQQFRGEYNDDFRQA
jgi:hypothetical protein